MSKYKVGDILVGESTGRRIVVTKIDITRIHVLYIDWPHRAHITRESVMDIYYTKKPIDYNMGVLGIMQVIESVRQNGVV